MSKTHSILTSVILFIAATVSAQVFPGGQSGMVLIGRTGMFDGSYLTGLQATNLVGNVPSAQFPTNTASFNTVTNDLVTGAHNLVRNQRGTLTVSIVGTSAPSGIEYSNAVTGQVRTFQAGLGDTNTVTIRFQPNSILAVTNATVLPNTSEINYE